MSNHLHLDGWVENMTVTSHTGRVYNLGSPYSRWFRFRVLIYRIRRYFEG